MNTALMFSTGKDDWETPDDLFCALDAEFGFDIDVAATEANAKKEVYLGPDRFRPDRRDALELPWSVMTSRATPAVCWCNPPYSRGLQGRFIAKAAQERLRGCTTVMLIPARTDTKAFHDHVWNTETHQPREGVEVRFLRGRLKFSGAKDAAPFPSMVVIFRGECADQRLR